VNGKVKWSLRIGYYFLNVYIALPESFISRQLSDVQRLQLFSSGLLANCIFTIVASLLLGPSAIKTFLEFFCLNCLPVPGFDGHHFLASMCSLLKWNCTNINFMLTSISTITTACLLVALIGPHLLG
jgi:Zn-dependent protease